MLNLLHLRPLRRDRGPPGPPAPGPRSRPGPAALAGEGHRACPVRLTQVWIDTLAAHGITDGPLIRAVDQYDRLAGTPRYAARRPWGGVPRIGNSSLNALVRASGASINDAAVARATGGPERLLLARTARRVTTSGGEAIAHRHRRTRPLESLLMVMQYWRDGAAWRRQIEAEIGL
ncbi:hypothetical protein HUT06_21430 [Actinomadura sp. NAK00032]|uniref:hypothetical protein n=1 Tax=Actinomadura sp. NAK00032 TaxID=2742128 RepID=UPI0015903B62|nr:hypothetical protein [Actinomadura sp. NAK00032]QKW36276.1 hypothetical protein HUT06_21430 [Actinomadura sp. NAK00032]